MKPIAELDYTQLKNICSPDNFTFQTTAELETLDEIIGQERAVKALDFGLAVKMKGYNIYISGPSGTGKTTYARNSAEKKAKTEPVPSDWCYVYNFQNPKAPIALSFEPGIGKQFKEDMAKLVSLIKKELQKVFQSEDFEKQKLTIIHSFEKGQNDLVDKMDALAAEYSFFVKRSDTSLYFLPLVNGEPLDEEALDALSPEENEIIDNNSQILQEKTAPLLREIQKLEKECDEKLTELEQKLGLSAIENAFQELASTYQTYERVVSYLDAVQKDILENLDQFMDSGEAQPDVLASLLPMLNKNPENEDITLKYRVNLIVDHSET